MRDHNGQALAYVYAEDKRTGARPLTRDEARRIAANIAKLPDPFRTACASALGDPVNKPASLPHAAEQCGPR